MPSREPCSGSRSGATVGAGAAARSRAMVGAAAGAVAVTRAAAGSQEPRPGSAVWGPMT